MKRSFFTQESKVSLLDIIFLQYLIMNYNPIIYNNCCSHKYFMNVYIIIQTLVVKISSTGKILH